MEDLEDNSYVIFAQANVWKSPNACNELGYYINKLMSCYKYDGPDQAGLVVNRMPEPDTNYRTRLGNVGIQINDSDRVISRPSVQDREKYKASYKRDQAKTARRNTQVAKDIAASTASRSLGGSQNLSQTQSQNRNMGIIENQ